MLGPSGVSIGQQTAVMRVVYVSNLEGCTVTGQTAGTEGGHTALVRHSSASGLFWSMNW